MTLQLIVSEASSSSATGWAVLNSNFTTSLLGSLAGAFGGAWAAQKIVERAARREQLRNEVLQSIKALEALFALCNSFLNLNEQFSRPLLISFEEQREGVIKYRDALRAGSGILDDISIKMECATLTPPAIKFDFIGEIILDSISISGRPRMIASMLPQTIEDLKNSISERNKWINQSRENRDGSAYLAKFFGLPQNGLVDRTYMDLVHQIAKGTDDCVFFSRMLIEDVRKHAEAMRTELKKEYAGPVPRIPLVDFSRSEKKNLFPGKAGYESWTAMHTRVPETHGRRFYFVRYVIRRAWRKLIRSRSAVIDQAALAPSA